MDLCLLPSFEGVFKVSQVSENCTAHGMFNAVALPLFHHLMTTLHSDVLRLMSVKKLEYLIDLKRLNLLVLEQCLKNLSDVLIPLSASKQSHFLQ